MVDLLPLCRPHEDPGLAGLFGQAVVDVRNDGEGGALWVADANIDPVISRTQQTAQCFSTGFISSKPVLTARVTTQHCLAASAQVSTTFTVNGAEQTVNQSKDTQEKLQNTSVLHLDT